LRAEHEELVVSFLGQAGQLRDLRQENARMQGRMEEPFLSMGMMRARMVNLPPKVVEVEDSEEVIYDPGQPGEEEEDPSVADSEEERVAEERDGATRDWLNFMERFIREDSQTGEEVFDEEFYRTYCLRQNWIDGLVFF